MSESGRYDVTAYVFGIDAQQASRVMEVLARAVAGIGLEGLSASVRIGPSDDDEGMGA